MAQVQTFFTSEILILPKKINFLTLQDKPEERFIFIKNLLDNYLSSKKDFASIKNFSFFNLEYINFPIEEIRRMQVEAEYSSSFSGQGNRVFVLFNFDTASLAAQNAALKIIEESPRNTLILLLVNKKEKILGTITSRCLTVQLEEKAEKIDAKTQKDFVWPKNYSQVVELAQENKDRSKAINLIEQLLEKKNLQTKQKQALLRAYQDLIANQNVQLALENCFFSLVHLES